MSGEPVGRRVRLGYLVSHPIQYQAPLLRAIAADPEIELTVLYGSDFSVRGYQDEGFGVELKWDVPLLDGYRHEFLPALRDNGTEGVFSPVSRGLMGRLTESDGAARFDALWVHGYGTVNQLQGILAAWALGIPVLVRSDSTLRDRPRGGLKRLVKRAFFAVLRELVSGVLVSGTWNAEYWREAMGRDFPLFLLPYAVDNAWWRERCAEARGERGALLAELGIEDGRGVILFASKMQTRKHCGDLVEAYGRLVAGWDREARGAEPYLVLVGDGEERAALEAQVAAAGLGGVRFAGFRNQSELPGFFALASVFVLPSRHEPWGLVVNEVMNAGCAVILSDDVGCHPDLVTSGVEGFVYPVRDVEALTAALRAVLKDEETVSRMGQAAAERVGGWGFGEDLVGLKRALAAVTRGLAAGLAIGDEG